ncbi:hypothetical protein M8C21_005613, partial [Ambrosia artemisiifolia]
IYLNSYTLSIYQILTMSIPVSLLLCMLFMSAGLGSSCIYKERQALLDVQASLIDFYGSLDGWGGKEENSTDCCKWMRVTCNNHTGHWWWFHSGSIPHQLANLSNLQHLDLSVNSLSGSIPHQLANLSNLQYLDLSGNSLSGSIPHQLANLSNLQYLYLSNNSLSGSIPSFFGDLTSLKLLDLSNNGLSGNVPNTLGRLSNLDRLDLSHNSLNGSIPNFIGSPLLWYLDMSSNQLHGNVPKSLGQLSKLQELNLRNNSLNGSIPNFIGSLPLSFLDMSSNQLHGNVPNSLGQLSQLVYLNLSSNSLEGVISEVHFLNLTSLRTLDLLTLPWGNPFYLRNNKITIVQAGTYVSNMDSNSTKLPILEFLGHPGMDLSNNHFEGGVPSLPSKLAALNLSGNKFSGTISFLCNFDGTLTLLDVSNNLLSGSLPDCWMKFQEKLVVLNLSNNNISGEIPSSLGTLSNLEALYLRKNAFVGEVPMSLRNCTRLKFVDLGENKLSGVIPEWIGEELS